MAYLKKDEEEDALNPTTPSSGGGLLGADAPTAGDPSEAPVGRPGQTGSGFVDLRQYLDANQEQSKELGGKVAGQLKSEATGLEGDIAQTEKDFNQAVNAGFGGPVAGGGSPRYNGPKSVEEFEGYAPLKQKIEDEKKRATLTESEPGRFELLSSFGGPQRSRGETFLDQYLLQNDPGAQTKLKEGSNAVGNLDNILGNFVTTGNQRIAGIMNQGPAQNPLFPGLNPKMPRTPDSIKKIDDVARRRALARMGR